MDQGTRKLMAMHKALHPRDVADFMCQEKKEDEDLPSSKTALTYQYNDLKNTKKNMKENWLQPLEIILTTRTPTGRQ